MVINPKQPWKQLRRDRRMPVAKPQMPLCAPGSEYSAYTLAGCLLMALVLLIGGCHQPAHAIESSPQAIDPQALAALRLHVEYSNDQIVEAIGRAEDSKAFPYGIMVKYKHTTPRQACLNTIQHARIRWIDAGRPGDFIVYLGRTYSPPDVNPEWVRLVRYFLRHPKITKK